jgi:hypothetical protein
MNGSRDATRSSFGFSMLQSRPAQSYSCPARTWAAMSEKSTMYAPRSTGPSLHPETLIGAVLTTEYAPFLLHLSLVIECRERIERALDRLDPDLNQDARLRMRLHSAGLPLILAMGPVEKTKNVVTKALEVAESLDDVLAQLYALRTMWVLHFNVGDFRALQLTAQRCLPVAVGRTRHGSFVHAWRGLRARISDVIASHSREHDFCFGDDFLLRRHDYRLEIAGGIPVTQYVHDIVQSDGFRFPVKRRAYVRWPHLKAIRDLLSDLARSE